MATGDKKRAVMTDDINNSGSSYPVLGPTGDGSNVTAAFTAADSRTNISTGEKLSVICGKIAKWFADLGAAAFRAVDATPTAGSTNLVESGGVKSALNAITPTYTVPSAGENITYQSGQLIAMKIGSLVSVGGILTVTGAVAAGDVLLSNMPVSSLGGAVANDQPVLVTAVNLSTYVETVITCKIGYNGTLKATDSIPSNTALRMGFTYSLYEV